jgi:uncharacterized protein (UPF0333 family)
MSSHAKNRAQASIEYLAIFAIAVIILVPMVYMFQRYTLQSAEAIQQSKLRNIGGDIVNTAETVYYMGYPARLTIQEDLPPGITGMNLTTDWSKNTNIFSFYLSENRELPYFCGVNINASFTPSSYSPGLKDIVFETRNSTDGYYIWIEFR